MNTVMDSRIIRFKVFFSFIVSAHLGNANDCKGAVLTGKTNSNPQRRQKKREEREKKLPASFC